MPTVFRTCNVCEAMCGLAIEVDPSGAIGQIRGDDDDVLSRGHLCPKGPAMKEVLLDPARLRRPLRRTAKGFVEVGWTEALDEAGARLRSAREQHGRDAVGVYIGNPTVHGHAAALAMVPFLKALGTRNRFDANSQDANPKLFACMLVYGEPVARAQGLEERHHRQRRRVAVHRGVADVDAHRVAPVLLAGGAQARGRLVERLGPADLDEAGSCPAQRAAQAGGVL